MKHIIIYILFFMFFISGCTQKTLLHPFGNNDGVAPGVVSDIRVRNFSGGATVSYKLPMDEDLSYVEATFTSTNGEERKVKASGYCDSLVLEGFGDTREYDVELRTYDKYENASSPVNVKINPLTPPVQVVYQSLKYTINFGGFEVEFKNPDKAEIGIYILKKNPETNEMEIYDIYFTEQASGIYPVRGLPDEENDFGIYIQDYWNNTSETLMFTGTPWKEDELDPQYYTIVNPNGVIGDNKESDMGDPWNRLFDGGIGCWNYAHTILPLPLPHRFTMDLGMTVKLSRVKLWQRDCEDTMWQHGGWKIFNFYGANEILPLEEQSADDPMKGWTLIGSFESIKPSGLPLGVNNEEDIQKVKDGEEFTFDINAEPVRYIRVEVLRTHSGGQFSCMSEMKLWGQVSDEESGNGEE